MGKNPKAPMSGRKVHGVRIGGEGPLCACGEWACDKAINAPSPRLMTWVAATALYLAGLLLIVGVCVALWNIDDTPAAPLVPPLPMPAPTPGPPVATPR